MRPGRQPADPKGDPRRQNGKTQQFLGTPKIAFGPENCEFCLPKFTLTFGSPSEGGPEAKNMDSVREGSQKSIWLRDAKMMPKGPLFGTLREQNSYFCRSEEGGKKHVESGEAEKEAWRPLFPHGGAELRKWPPGPLSSYIYARIFGPRLRRGLDSILSPGGPLSNEFVFRTDTSDSTFMLSSSFDGSRPIKVRGE